MGWFDRWRGEEEKLETSRGGWFNRSKPANKEDWSDQLQKGLATKVNDMVDIPMIGEAHEQKIAEKVINFDRLRFKKEEETPKRVWEDYVSMTPEARGKLRELEDLTTTQTALIAVCTGASFAIGFKLGRAQMPWTRFTNVTDIPSTYFGPTAPFLRGRVVSVSDGDTIRFLSAPTVFHSSRVQKDQKMSDVALPIRVCTIDTPETAKFGKPGQPFGDDAKALLTNMVDDKIVRVRLLQKDQYGRAVAEVRSGIFPFYKYMDEQMLKGGLAEVYQGSGAVYGFKGKEAYIDMQEKASLSKKGMWAQDDRESAAEFKARMKAQG